MPIEIKELVISASVQDKTEDSNNVIPTLRSSDKTDSSKEEQIVNRCVEQVMEIIRIQNER